MQPTRREFLNLAGGAMLTAGALAGAGKAAAANDRIQFAGIGLRSRGWALTRCAHESGLADIAALCDVDQKVLEKRAAEVKEMTGKTPRLYQDVRELYADEGIDAVAIAVPNHWHVLAAIWAMQAGKDVYVEKPISHTIFEGRQLVNAWKKTGRVVQHGTQRRSEGPWQRAAERVHAGAIGTPYMARITIFRFREPFNYPFNESPPEFLDWKLWQGPATEQAFSRNFVHYNWHWFWHYGNGEIGNNGPHRTDIVNWVLDKGLPVETASTGGIFGYAEDARETPNTQVVQHTFADGTLFTIDVRNRHTPSSPSTIVLGTEGYMQDTTLYDPDDKVIPDDSPREAPDNSSVAHMTNFLKAVQAQDPGAVPATPEQGHVAAALCHLGNIAYRTGRKLRFDPKTEQFEGDEAANALLTRQYREGFEVPEIA